MSVTHLNQVELAARWKISPRTLERWRWTGEIGGRVVYRLEDVAPWAARPRSGRRARSPLFSNQWRTGRGVLENRHHRDRPHSQHDHRGRLMMSSGRLAISTTLTDVTRSADGTRGPERSDPSSPALLGTSARRQAPCSAGLLRGVRGARHRFAHLERARARTPQGTRCAGGAAAVYARRDRAAIARDHEADTLLVGNRAARDP